MSDWLAVIILGIIEGVTEFLPVSSTGHLLLVQNNGWLPKQSDLFNVVIQSGAVLAVILVFAKRMKQFALEWRKPEVGDYLLKLAVAFGVTAGGGFVLKALDWKLPETAWPVLLATVIGGVAIIAIEKWLKGRPLSEQITWGVAIAAGVAQLVAGACPGTSRSGATILTIMALGLARPAATEFSFLLGIPTLLGAGAYEAAKALKDSAVWLVGAWCMDMAGFHDAAKALKAAGPMKTSWDLVFLGTIVSAVTAFVVVKWLLKFVQSHTFVGFGWYRIALGAVILLLMFR